MILYTYVIKAKYFKSEFFFGRNFKFDLSTKLETRTITLIPLSNFLERKYNFKRKYKQISKMKLSQ